MLMPFSPGVSHQSAANFNFVWFTRANPVLVCECGAALFPMLPLSFAIFFFLSPNCVAQTSRPCGKIAAHGQEQFPDSLGSDEREVGFTPHITRAARDHRSNNTYGFNCIMNSLLSFG